MFINNKMYSFDEWYKFNKKVLKHLFQELFFMCEKYGIQLIDDKESHTNFYLMMYNESNKDIIDGELYSELFY